MVVYASFVGVMLRPRSRAVGTPLSGWELATASQFRGAGPDARLSGPLGELLLFLFGRQAAAQVDVNGPTEVVAAVDRTHFGM
jgi:hypothetical protein